MSHVDGPPGYEPADMGSVRPEDLDGVPAPGALGIKEKRTWKTWQLVGAVVIAVLVGMLINYRTVGASASGGSSGTTGGGSYTPPPPAGATSTTVPPGGSSAGTTAPPGSTSTSTSTGGTTHHHHQGQGFQGHHDNHRHDLIDLWIIGNNDDNCPGSLVAWTNPVRGQLDQSGFHDHGVGLEHRVGIPMHPCSHGGDFVPGVRHPCGFCAGQCCGNKRNRRIGSGCHGPDEPR